jgi:hypothetical protein
VRKSRKYELAELDSGLIIPGSEELWERATREVQFCLGFLETI